MHNTIRLSEDLVYVGGSDRRISLFENVYPVPRGISYNSYLLLDEKTVLFDTVDPSVADLYLENVAHALGGRKLDYLVVQHMEPDHSATFLRLISAYPGVRIVASQKAAQMLSNFFPFDGAVQTAKEGDVLETGKHRLLFVMAPMVHWPEVMVTFDETSGTLFSADAFGTFGAISGNLIAGEDFERDLLDDARRYYFNIVGKYGIQVQAVLKKAAGLPIKQVCPLHGPVWREGFSAFLAKYDTWSKYLPEEWGVAVFYGTIHGHTGNAADIFAAELAANGVKNIKVYDVAQTELSRLVAEAFRYSHLVFLSATYNNGIFLPMDTFLHDLAAHGFRGRKYALAENGSWSPQAGTLMQGLISEWKDMTQIGEKITILSSVKEKDREALGELARLVAEDLAACGE